MLDYFKVGVQYLVPSYLLSNMMHKLANSQIKWLKNIIIKYLVRVYNVNLDEAKVKKIENFKSVNDFFTRELDTDVRNIADVAWVSPVDGYIRESREIKVNTLIQAKKIKYTLAELVEDENIASYFENGFYQNIYLSPQDYHRVHMPKGGKLLTSCLLSGDLFAVNKATDKLVPKLYAKNERLVLLFEDLYNKEKFAMIMVGAILVGSIETVFAGKMVPPHNYQTQIVDYANQNLVFEKGQEIGRFNMGSTVILLSKANSDLSSSKLTEEQQLKLGQSLL